MVVELSFCGNTPTQDETSVSRETQSAVIASVPICLAKFCVTIYAWYASSYAKHHVSTPTHASQHPIYSFMAALSCPIKCPFCSFPFIFLFLILIVIGFRSLGSQMSNLTLEVYCFQIFLCIDLFYRHCPLTLFRHRSRTHIRQRRLLDLLCNGLIDRIHHRLVGRPIPWKH